MVLSLATDSNKIFYVIIPRFNIFITNRPVHPMSISSVFGKVSFAPTVAMSSPHQGTTTYVITSHPIKPFYFRIWMIQIVHEKMLTGIIDRITCSSLYPLLLKILLGRLPTIGHIPRIEVHSWIVFDVFYVTASFQYKCFQTLFA